MRLIASAVFVALATVGLYVVSDAWKQHHDTAWTLAVVAVYFGCGFFVGDWRALVLAFVPVLIAVPAGVQGDNDGTPVWWWVLVDTVFINVWITAAGVAARWFLRRELRSRPVPAS